LRKDFVIPDDGGAPVGCFRPGESHGGKERGHPVTSEPSLFGSGLIEGVCDGLEWKDSVFDSVF